MFRDFEDIFFQFPFKVGRQSVSVHEMQNFVFIFYIANKNIYQISFILEFLIVAYLSSVLNNLALFYFLSKTFAFLRNPYLFKPKKLVFHSYGQLFFSCLFSSHPILLGHVFMKHYLKVNIITTVCRYKIQDIGTMKILYFIIDYTKSILRRLFYSKVLACFVSQCNDNLEMQKTSTLKNVFVF